MKIVKLSESTTFPDFRELTPEEVSQAYKLAREAFTAEDLQRYTEVDEGVPMEQVLAEMEDVQKQSGEKSR